MDLANLSEAIQEQIGAQYRLTGVIEAGAGLTVFRVIPLPETPHLEDAVIVVDTSDEGVHHFKKYLEASFLDHPNLLRIFHVGWVEAGPERLPYIAAESPEITLEESANQKPLSRTATAELRAQVFAGLTYLHGQNLDYGELRESGVWHVGDEWKLSDYRELRVAESSPLRIDLLEQMLRRVSEGVVSQEMDSQGIDSQAMERMPNRTLEVSGRLLQIAAVGVVLIAVVAAALWRRPDHSSGTQVPHAATTTVSRPETRVEPAALPATPAEHQPPTRGVSVPDGEVEIHHLLNRWAQATRNRSAEDLLTCYAPVVAPYFGTHQIAASELAANKRRVFSQIGPVERFSIEKFQIHRIGTEEAMVSFDKSWRFGGRRPFWGSAREQMRLRNYTGNWKIAGETEIKVYVSDKGRWSR